MSDSPVTLRDYQDLLVILTMAEGFALVRARRISDGQEVYLVCVVMIDKQELLPLAELLPLTRDPLHNYGPLEVLPGKNGTLLGSSNIMILATTVGKILKKAPGGKLDLRFVGDSTWNLPIEPTDGETN